MNAGTKFYINPSSSCGLILVWIWLISGQLPSLHEKSAQNGTRKYVSNTIIHQYWQVKLYYFIKVYIFLRVAGFCGKRYSMLARQAILTTRRGILIFSTLFCLSSAGKPDWMKICQLILNHSNQCVLITTMLWPTLKKAHRFVVKWHAHCIHIYI